MSSRVRVRHRAVAPGASNAIRGVGALLLAALMALGCVVLWAGIPLGGFWLAAAISDNATTVYVVALVGVPLTMTAWGLALAQVNRAYLRLRGTQEPKLFHALLVGSVFLAILAFLVWYFFFSPPPSATPWPDEFSGPGN